MKIALNIETLSICAVKEYAKRKGFDLYFYTFCHNKDYKYQRQNEGSRHSCIGLYENLGQRVTESEFLEYFKRNDDSIFSIRNSERSDPDLIYVVEKYMDVDADGRDARVAEIPDDVEWIIDQNECGHEWVAEVHRTWDACDGKTIETRKESNCEKRNYHIGH